MTYSVIRWDKIRTHLSRSCIISSYFWMTLAPSGDSRHLQRRWDFTTHAKGYIQYLPRPIFQNIIFMRPLKQLTERLSLEMHDHSEIHFFNLLRWAQERRLTGRRGVWIWRRGSGCAAGAPGPTSAHRLLLAYSYSLESNLRRSGVITYTGTTIHHYHITHITHIVIFHIIHKAGLHQSRC